MNVLVMPLEFLLVGFEIRQSSIIACIAGSQMSPGYAPSQYAFTVLEEAM